MPRLRCAFLNCRNLFPVGAVARGPPSQAALDQQVADLGATLAGLFGGPLPDVVGLCEIGDEPLGRAVAEAVSAGRYRSVWSGQPSADQSGLTLLFDPAAVLPVGGPVTDQTQAGQSSSQRVRWLALLLELQVGGRGAFWLMANHWKSQLGGERQTESDRADSARLIGEFFLETARVQTEAMMLLGDFNCEPGDRPFKSQAARDPTGTGDDRPNALRGCRERALVLRERNRLAYFYNPMWRWLGEADTLAVAGAPGYVAPRTMGTHGPGVAGGPGWLMFDQLLVTKRLLRGGPATLVEESLRVCLPVGGCSDHCALGAEFEC